jgi:flagellar basal body-associated protein FliL
MQEAAAARLNATNVAKATQVKIKRKVGYEEDDDKEMSEARQKLVNMRMKE